MKIDAPIVTGDRSETPNLAPVLLADESKTSSLCAAPKMEDSDVDAVKLYVDAEIAAVVGDPADIKAIDSPKINGVQEDWKPTELWLQNLTESVKQQGVLRTIFYWLETGAVLDGIKLFQVCEKLGLKQWEDYDIEGISLSDIGAAKQWRYKMNISTSRQLPPGQRAYEFLKNFHALIDNWRTEGKENIRRVRRGEKIAAPISWRKRASQLAMVSEAEIYNTWECMHMLHTAIAEGKLTPAEERRLHANFVKMTKGQYSAKSLRADIKGTVGRSAQRRRNEKALKNASAAGNTIPLQNDSAQVDIKSTRGRTAQNRRNEKALDKSNLPLEVPISETSAATVKHGSVICGDTFELIKSFEAGSIVDFIFSPPYCYADINYRQADPQPWLIDRVLYKEKMNGLLREMHRVIPETGKIVVQIADSRDPKTHREFNVIAWLHQIMVEELGMFDFGTIVWDKQSVCGRKMGFGSAEKTSLRRNHEYVLGFTKAKFEKVSPTEFDKDLNNQTMSTWHPEDVPSGSTGEQMWSSFWEVAPSHDKKSGHPCVFPMRLAYNMIQRFTGARDVICDPFCGTGTTLKMSAMLGRPWIGIEQNQEWARVAEDDAIKCGEQARKDSAWFKRELLKMTKPIKRMKKAAVENGEKPKTEAA